jgi:superfamily II DNA or RNA helicase
MQTAKDQFFRLLDGSERLFESGKDGYPANKELKYMPSSTLKMRYCFSDQGIVAEPWFGESSLQGLPVQLLDEVTPFIIAGTCIVSVPAGLKPSRLKPFALKKAIEVQKSFAGEYARKIILPDLKAGLAVLEGDAVQETIPLERAELEFNFHFEGAQTSIFSPDQALGGKCRLPEKLEVNLSWFYGKWKAPDVADKGSSWMYEESGGALFHQLKRDKHAENHLRTEIENLTGLLFKNGESKIRFEFLRDAILPVLDKLPAKVEYRFSPEFAQLSMKPLRLRYEVFEKIDYFQIEGSLDWDDGEMDFIRLRAKFQLENGWLRIGDQFYPVEAEDGQFLEQLMLISSGKEELRIPRTAALALKQQPVEFFSEKWNRITSLLSTKESKVTADDFSPNFKLRDYQGKGLEWFVQLANNRFGGILADDMGLGKTFQAAAFLRYLRENREKTCSLIVVPSTLLFNWKQELSRFSPDFRVCIHHGPQRAQDIRSLFEYFDVLLVSYQTLLRDIGLFSNLSFATLIADEAQHLKNPSTAAYQAVKKIQAGNAYLLTGTPLQNSPADLWALSELCNPGLLSQKISPGSLQKNENPERLRKNMELMQALVKPFMLRRTKESVLSELPEKSVSVLYCGMGEEQELEYLASNQLLSGQIHDLALQQGRGLNVRILKALTTLRQLANHPAMLDPEYSGSSGKFELVKEKLSEVLEEGRKVLVFSSFVRHLQLLENYLQEENLPYARLTGQTTDRKAQVEKFQRDPECRIFLISLKAGGFGLNLVEASCVFLLDPWWNPAAESQAMDRVHRIGQKDRVTVYKFITANTVEEKILQLQEQKSAMNDQLFSDTDAGEAGGALSIEMLQSILSTKV